MLVGVHLMFDLVEYVPATYSILILSMLGTTARCKVSIGGDSRYDRATGPYAVALSTPISYSSLTHGAG